MTTDSDSKKLAEAAVAVLMSDANTNAWAAADALAAAGFSLAEARRAVMLVPIAFCRAILQHSGATFPDAYSVLEPATGERTDHALSTDPLFAAATLQIAACTQATLTAVAEMSPEYDAARQAVEDGSELANLTFAPPMIPADFLRGE